MIQYNKERRGGERRGESCAPICEALPFSEPTSHEVRSFGSNFSGASCHGAPLAALMTATPQSVLRDPAAQGVAFRDSLQTIFNSR